MCTLSQYDVSARGIFSKPEGISQPFGVQSGQFKKILEQLKEYKMINRRSVSRQQEGTCQRSVCD